MSGPRTLGGAFASGRNDFDAIRLGAALLVLASHAWVLTGRAEDEPFARLLLHLTDGGGLAVGVFFVLSGFLIARSAERHRTVAYVRARALRIYPAFLAVVLLQAFVLGPVMSRLGVGAYLTQPGTWWAVARALVFSPPPGLPRVFEGNALPWVVNGSLWTLRIEVICYAGLLVLVRAGLLRAGTVWLPLAVAWGGEGAVLAARAGLLPPVLASLPVVAILDCGLNFAMGAALWGWRDRIALRFWPVAAGVGLTALAAGTAAGPLLFHATLPYAVLWLGLVRPVTGGVMGRMGDVSYGTYLVAFPVQQLLVAGLGPGLGPLGLIAASVPLSLAYAFASRVLIEVPALRLRRQPRDIDHGAHGVHGVGEQNPERATLS